MSKPNVGFEPICRCCKRKDSVMRSLCQDCLDDKAIKLEECAHGELAVTPPAADK